MTRTAVYIRDNPNATGDCDWQDLVNNWRDVDATWLQERGITRVTTTPDADTNLANTNEGRLFYSTNNKAAYLSTTGGPPFSRLLAAKALVVDESVAGKASIGASGHVAPGISFDTATGNVTIGNLTITTLASLSALTLVTLSAGTAAITGAGGLTLRTDGATTVTLTTSAANGLEIDHGLNANGPVKGTSGVFTTLSAGGTSLGITVVSSTLSVGTSVSSPVVTSPVDLTVSLLTGRAMRFVTPTVADANFFYGPTGTAIRMAWVVVNATDPGILNVPEGTIWIQP